MASRDPNRWMWAEALQMLDEANRLQRRFFEVSVRPAAQPRWEPPVDVFETDGALWIQVALPGVKPEQLEVRIEGNAVVVAGERTLPTPRGAGVIRRLEMPYGEFERRIGLSPGHYELSGRELAHGCLTLTLRKLG